VTRKTESTPIEWLPGGSWSSVPGTRVGCASGGIKSGSEAGVRDDVAVLWAPGVAAAVTTRSSAAAAPCRWTRALAPGQATAVVVNSGNANAATGPQGQADLSATVSCLAEALGCSPSEVWVCSTGVIGVPLPMERLLPAITRAAATLEGDGLDAAQAIMTTDLVPKACAARSDGITVGGIAKGSGMIHPNMATMLGFVSTDVVVDPADLQTLLEEVTERTFNAITVDGDCSTNDTVIVQATAKGIAVRPGTAEWDTFSAVLEAVCTRLAKAIAQDGEGARHLIEVQVAGTASAQHAREAARAVAGSSLVKTAIAGHDANWGRVVGALGQAEVQGLDQLDLTFAGIEVVKNGRPCAFDEAAATKALSAPEVIISVTVPGEGYGRAWGCDMTEDYVRINADYRT